MSLMRSPQERRQKGGGGARGGTILLDYGYSRKEGKGSAGGKEDRALGGRGAGGCQLVF